MQTADQGPTSRVSNLAECIFDAGLQDERLLNADYGDLRNKHRFVMGDVQF